MNKPRAVNGHPKLRTAGWGAEVWGPKPLSGGSTAQRGSQSLGGKLLAISPSKGNKNSSLSSGLHWLAGMELSFSQTLSEASNR